MLFKVRSWWQVFAFSSIITAFATAVPLVIVSAALWQVPWVFKKPVIAIAGLIPLFIAFPVSIFALYVLKLVTNTIDVLDTHVKFDHLTGLLTRGYFLSAIEIQRTHAGYFLLLDADNFKQINDRLGHDHGDEVLKHIARSIQQIVGGQGLAGRLGGEEFAIYLPRATVAQAKLLATGIGAALRTTNVGLHGRDVTVTASIGIAAEHAGESVANVMKRADNCLYAAKQNGRDCFVVDAESAASGIASKLVREAILAS